MLTKLAVRYLTYRLRKDEELWIAYKASIAMSIWDTYYKYHPIQTQEERKKFCNTSAEEFLNLWTKRK